jgi:hypothetical protein
MADRDLSDMEIWELETLPAKAQLVRTTLTPEFAAQTHLSNTILTRRQKELKSRLSKTNCELSGERTDKEAWRAQFYTQLRERKKAEASLADAQEALQEKHEQLAAARKLNEKLANGTTGEHASVVDFLKTRLGAEESAKSELRAEHMMQMFRALGFDHEPERACALLDVLEERRKQNKRGRVVSAFAESEMRMRHPKRRRR